MAITNNSVVVETVPVQGNVWSISMQSADLSGCEELKAAETGKSHYITKIAINCISAINVSLGSGETVAGTMDTVALGPIAFTAAGPNYILSFTDPAALALKGVKLPVGTSFVIDASGGGAVHVYAEGKTG
jgi:hypothetical protein